MHADHPYTDPGDGRKQCATCGKWVWLVTHSCKGIRVAPPSGYLPTMSKHRETTTTETTETTPATETVETTTETTETRPSPIEHDGGSVEVETTETVTED